MGFVEGFCFGALRVYVKGVLVEAILGFDIRLFLAYL